MPTSARRAEAAGGGNIAGGASLATAPSSRILETSVSDDSSNPISRRGVVGAAGAGLAAAAVGGARAQGETSGTAAPVVDPRSKYPKPPFP